MKKKYAYLIAIIFAMISLNSLKAQVALPPDFKKEVKKEYDSETHHEVSFEWYYKIKKADYIRVQTTPLSRQVKGGQNSKNVPFATSVCGNGGFDSPLSTTDWYGEYGSLDASDLPDFDFFSAGFMSGPINLTTSRHTIVPAGPEPNVPINITRDGTGSSLRIGNERPSQGSEMISKRFTVPSGTDALISFWYAVVLQDPFPTGGTPHTLEEYPSFWVRIVDYTAGGVVVPGLVNLGAGSDRIFGNPADPFLDEVTVGSQTIAYKDWTCVQMNLSSLIGHDIEINFITEDCGLGAHFGYAYIDDFCGSCVGNPGGYFDIDLKKTDSCGPGEICVNYDLPGVPGGPTGSVTLGVDIYQDGVLVGTLPGISAISGSSYCWTVSESFLATLDATLGGFDFVIHADFYLSGSLVGSMDVGTAPEGIEPGLNNDYLINCSECWLDQLQNSEYTTIPNSISIGSDQVWSGKYYIPDGVIINVSNAILDLTNVDIVFGECAGMVFQNNATLRANNSVFRPCNMEKTWLGFLFRGDANGVVNECTYKNAQVALDLKDIQSAYLRVANNLFQNCRVGIGASNVIFLNGITGNTFNVDKNNIAYNVNCQNAFGPIILSGTTYANDHWGILAKRTQFRGNISQNDFVDVQEITGEGTDKIVYGVSFSGQSSGAISDNNFTDLYRSIDVHNSAFVYIEHNEIELNSLNYLAPLVTNQHQIRVSDSYGVQITTNDLMYGFRNEPGGNFSWDTHSAIYLENVQRADVMTNNITGFESGIQVQNSSSSMIKENHLLDIGYCGIYVNEGFGIEGMCNTINMEDDFGTTSIGIYYKTTAFNDASIRFSGNCIFEASTSILVEGVPGACVPLPQLTNNFLYNYTEYGLDAQHASGVIGTGGVASDGGRNTFASNNTTTGSVDIRALACPISTNGNFGIITTSGAITVGSNVFYSTASCGSQLTEEKNILRRNYNETCDPKFSNSSVLVNTNTGALLSPDYKVELGKTNNLEKQIPQWFNTLQMSGKTVELDQLYRTLISGEYALHLSYVEYEYYLAKEDYSAARNALEQIGLVLSDDWYALQEVILKLGDLGKELSSSDTELIAELQLLTQDRSVHYKATQLLQQALAGNDFPFIAIPRAKSIANTDIKELSQNRVVVFPNPANDVLKVNYSLEIEHSASLRIVNILGEVMQEQTITNSSGESIIDVSLFKSGVYFIDILNDNGERNSIRFVKM